MTNDFEEGGQVLSQWQLIWRRFLKHRVAMAAVVVLLIFYLIAIFCEFIAPYDPFKRYPDRIHVPPQTVQFVDEEGQFHLRPFVYGLKSELNMETFEREYTIDKGKKYPIYFLVSGDTYKLWGIFESDLHLFGTKENIDMFLLGTDHLGRDLLTRILYGTRISLSIGLIGVFLSLVLGLLIGGISGLLGGMVDNIIQRIIEILRSIPQIPLWMGLSAALPPEWSPIKIYFAITVLLSLLGWTNVGRVVRGKFLSLREQEFVLAAHSAGASYFYIIVRHLIPNFLSYVLVSVTLSIPWMILGETSLSFLGIGLRPPVVSWGVLLKQAQNIAAVNSYPWMLTPGIFVIIVVLAFNFVGDGLRDAADPYSS